jgi:HlyD family secretion protein
MPKVNFKKGQITSKRVVWGIVIILIVAVIASILLTAKEVDVTLITPKTAELTFTETGTVVSQSRVDIYPLAAGEIKSVYLKEGAKVETGDILCRLDTTALQSELKQAQNTVRSYEAQKAQTSRDEQIRQQNTVITQNINNLQQAEEDFALAERLYENGVISRKDYDTALLNLQNTRLVLEQSREQLKIIENSAEGTEEYYAALIASGNSTVEQIRKRIDDCTIRSPISGVVTTLTIEHSNFVNAQAPIATITTEGTSVIEAYISIKDISAVHEGMPVTITLEQRANDSDFEGIISEIDNKAVSKVSVLGAEEKRVKVKIDFFDDSLKEGYEVKVKIRYYYEENQVVVPKTALFKEKEQYMVWTVKNGKAHKTAVEKGMELRTENVIKSGINDGDFVITDCNNADIREGVRIKT